MEPAYPFTPTSKVIWVTGIFVVFYLLFLTRRTMRGDIDLYDLFMLSTLALIPAGFVFVPGLANVIAVYTGVAFSFVVMFGMLFVVLFVFVNRLTTTLHCLQKEQRLLTQEIALLRQKVEEIENK